MRTVNTGNEMTGERDKVWYGAVVFWILVAGLITARVMLVDVGKLHPAVSLASASAVSTTTLTAKPDSSLTTIGAASSRYFGNL